MKYRVSEMAGRKLGIIVPLTYQKTYIPGAADTTKLLHHQL